MSQTPRVTPAHSFSLSFVHTSFLGKDGAMASRYDENTKAKAVRLVREHGGDYDSEWAAMCAISARLGMTAETLRKWVRQAEVDAGEAAGVPTETARELRELRRKNRELEQAIVISRPPRLSSRGSATRDTADLCVHRRTRRPVRGGTDLPRARWARCADRPAQLLGAPVGRTVEAGAVGRHDRRDPGRRLRARRRRQTPAGVPVRQPEDVGAPAAPGHPGGPLHGGTDQRANGWHGATRVETTDAAALLSVRWHQPETRPPRRLFGDRRLPGPAMLLQESTSTEVWWGELNDDHGGTRLASGSGDQTVRLWDAATGRPVGDPLIGHTESVLSLAFSPDGTRLASGSGDETVQLWDAATGRPVGDPLIGHTESGLCQVGERRGRSG